MISYPHRIRLRGPWECDWAAGVVTRPDGRQERLDGPLSPPLRLTMPCRWREGGLPGFAGQARCRRRFGYPGRLDDYERVWLTFAGVTAAAEVWLNGRCLGCGSEADGPFEFDVTALLQLRNELLVAVEAASDAGGLWGEVALEVRRTAFLRGLRAWLFEGAEGVRLVVTGQVVGQSERPLELYGVVGARTVLDARVEPAREGRPFQLASEPLTDVPEQSLSVARIELIDGSVLWYGAQVEVGGQATAPGGCLFLHPPAASDI